MGDASSGDLSSWSTGLCGCFSDVPNCCLTIFCPCITFGRIAEIVDDGNTSCGRACAAHAMAGFYISCLYRSKMRKQYKLKKSHCDDCLIHLFCGMCALCQEYREVQLRVNDKQNRGVTMAVPKPQGGMSR